MATKIKFYDAAGKTVNFIDHGGDRHDYTFANNVDCMIEVFSEIQKLNPEIIAWQEDPEEVKKAIYAEINQKYLAEIANIREAIRLCIDTGKDVVALRGKLAEKQAEYKSALLAV